MANIFDNNNTNEEVEIPEVKLEDLVGDTQKYRTADDLAKAYAHADAHLAKMQQKLVELEAERKVLRDLAESGNKNSNSPPPKEEEDDDGSGNEPPAQPNPSGNQNDEKDLSERIRALMEEADTEKKFAKNVDLVAEKLQAYYGSEAEARKAVANKAKELNVSTDWLMDVAGKSPTAFFGTIGIDQRSVSTPGVNSDVNTAAFGKDRNRKNFAYFEEIRKTDPRLYYSAQMRKELLAAAREQGEKFYT